MSTIYPTVDSVDSSPERRAFRAQVAEQLNRQARTVEPASQDAERRPQAPISNNEQKRVDGVRR